MGNKTGVNLINDIYFVQDNSDKAITEYSCKLIDE